MNVSADLLFELAQASKAPTDYRADGVVRWATSVLKGEREWWVEVWEERPDGESCWEFHSIAGDPNTARTYAKQLEARWNRKYRAVEMIRRVLP